VGGFSLVEIVVVLLILGVSAAIVVPSLRAGARDEGVPAAAPEIARLLRAARRAALEQAVPVTVSITPGSRRYMVWAEQSDTAGDLGQGALPGGEITPAGGRSRFQVVFDRFGTAAPDSLTVRGSEGSAVVGVNRWSGEPYVRVAGR